METKSSTEHFDDAVKGPGKPTNDEVYGFVADQATLSKKYFYSASFLGTMMATGLGLMSAVGGFGLAAPNLTLINNEIGPSPDITWVSLVYTLTMAIGLLLVGRLSDLFGRRVSSPPPAPRGCILKHNHFTESTPSSTSSSDLHF